MASIDITADHARSLSDPNGFWCEQASHLSWTTPPSTALKTFPSDPTKWQWFPDAHLIPTYNLITRHIVAGRGSHPAILFESPVTATSYAVTYAQLQEEVEVLAQVLRDLGVRCGDRVIIYMPMIPEAVFAMLACTHIGAIHVVVFGGFAPAECAKRIDGAKPLVLLTASCGFEKDKLVPYVPFIREAKTQAKFPPRFTLILQRPELHALPERALGELSWNGLVRSLHARRGPPLSPTVSLPGGGMAELGASLPATAPHYILHTSGTTGTPKGCVRSLSHLIGLSYTARALFNLSPDTKIFTASDIGWVVGHSYIVYAPLLAGASTILYEGKPVGTPDCYSFWRLLEKHRANTLFCAPSALRAILAQDPDLTGLRNFNISSLSRLFLAGERSEPALVRRFSQCLPPQARVIDNWWSTESGSPITASHPGLSLVPGSAGKPMPGFDLRVDDDGRLVLHPPLPPTAFSDVWGERSRYQGYFENGLFNTGDLGSFSPDGVVTVQGRSDDTINVASHRLPAAALEAAAASVEGVTEAYVVPSPDEMKGEVPVAFVVAREGEKVDGKVKAKVREMVGPIATVKEVVRIPAEAVPRTRSGKVLRRAFRGILKGEDRVPEGVNGQVWEGVRQVCREKGLLGVVKGERAKL